MTTAALFGPGSGVASAFNAGQNGTPTSGHHTNLHGRAGDVTLTFQTNATLNCKHGDTAQQFNFKLNYQISGAPLPAGSVIVVYLSPNNGAINGNAGGNDAAYIAQVESNEATIPVVGLSGSGTLTFALPVTSAFQLATGGVLGVIADDVSGVAWTSKTNSLNCGEALATEAPTATPTQDPTQAPTQAPTTAPGGGVEAETGTPNVTLPPTDTISDSSSGSAGSGLQLALLGMAGLLAAVLLLTPAPVATERKKRN